jgi:hypothetical protein
VVAPMSSPIGLRRARTRSAGTPSAKRRSVTSMALRRDPISPTYRAGVRVRRRRPRGRGRGSASPPRWRSRRDADAAERLADRRGDHLIRLGNRVAVAYSGRSSMTTTRSARNLPSVRGPCRRGLRPRRRGRRGAKLSA